MTERLTLHAMTPAREKQLIRQRIASLRSALPADEHERKSAEICGRIWRVYLAGANRRGGEGAIFATYMPHRSEVNVAPLAELCWAHGIRVALPKVEAGAKRLRLHIIDSFDDLETGAYGIREPKAGTPMLTDPAQIKWMLVPGLAFDASFARLGYGGGYYDRFFEQLADRHVPRPMLIAAAFELQIVPSLPVEPHDFRMDAIVTERRVLAREPRD